VYDNFNRKAVERVEAGDICAFAGLGDVGIGETVCAREAPVPLPTITVEEPTVRMTFMVNTSPFAGREGKFVTSRNIRERLDRELERNLALKVESGETADTFIVSGRGALHISILIENMRREGFEFAVGPPKVITREVDGRKQEPYEEAIVEVPEEHVGQVVDLLGQRKGQMLDMAAPQGNSTLTRLTYKMPTRGLLGIRNAILTATKGTAVLNTIFLEYGPWCGVIDMRENGSLVGFETGQVTSYALESVQQRGKLFVGPGDEIYEGQVIGIHQRQGDLKVNACKKKAATNIRSATKEQTTALNEPMRPGLDDALEYIIDDELVEVTPKSVRIRKGPVAKRK
jgi:GTP-binding protein